ncbi:RyR domain-containing protein [Nocardia sp. CA-119907]|uniref:RyR domain-containing protein n=1 Tax=Nocardia sp. CA-119907 TaxID=3239973 RepID=UPI003D9552D6
MEWTPAPVDTSSVRLPPNIQKLVERLAENAHDRWAARRMSEGWRFGPSRSDDLLTHPSLVPYPDLPEQEKDYDRELATETIKAVLTLGYRIVPPED